MEIAASAVDDHGLEERGAATEDSTLHGVAFEPKALLEGLEQNVATIASNHGEIIDLGVVLFEFGKALPG